ncbi:MAG: M36 family metallopeptidase [Saprospiraceae bacterium]|nr:M36 family metallopeptidase [Saprospiraceae bacterium]
MKNQIFINLVLFCCVLFMHQSFAQTNSEIALQFMRANPQEFGLSANDVKEIAVTNETFFKPAGLHNVYIQQKYLGIPIHNAIFSVHIKDGQVVSTSNRFCQDIHSKTGSSEPVLTQGQALMRAAEQLGYPAPASMRMMENKGGSQKEVVYEKSNLSLEDIPVRLVWVAAEDGKIYLTWEVCIYETTAQNWWLARVDASTGNLTDKNNLVVHCNFDAPEGTCSGGDHVHLDEFVAFSPLDGSSYRVYKEPIESPSHGGRTLENEPADPTASPFGWHDTNGAVGPEYTTTRGNNVHAYTDTDANNSPDPGSDPDGGAGLDFDFTLDLTMHPSTYRPAAVTNLFYWNNYLHDFAYQYGFDEGNGNFQVNNYGNGGIGNDDVRAEAQDGSGTNNANFGTPVDGMRPRMQMYVWTYTSPNRDSDLDNGVIAHEYAHGISNRLTGGPGNVSCLNNAEQMGEGWSDFYSLMTCWTGSASDRGIGTYVLGQATNGPGIRPARYSTNMGVNNYTYANLPGMAVPHGVGFVWCTMLWELVDGLVARHGATAGFEKAMHLVNLGMILQPCGPGFVDGRNAILAADDILYGKDNECVIWKAFAKRGLGLSASQGSANSTLDGSAAYDVPCNCDNVAPVVSCRNVEIMVGGPEIELKGLPPVPTNLPAQLKGVGFPCSGVVAAPDVICNCPTGYVVVGYEADYGNGWGSGVLSKFRLRCREVRPDGMFGTNEVWTCYNGSAVGSTPNISEMAPAGHALVGFQNRMGCAIDRLTGRSKPISAILANSPNSTNNIMTGVGGSGGGLQPLQLAPDGHVIIGMQTYVDPVAPNIGVSGGYAWKYAKLSDVMKSIVTDLDPLCNGIFDVQFSKNNFDCADGVGVHNVSAFVTDYANNTTTCNFTVTVTGPPSIGSCPLNPTVYNALGRTSVFTSVNLAGTGSNVANVKPGQAVSFTFNRTTTVNPGCGGCCGCITQHYVGLNAGSGNIFSTCLFSAVGGSSASHSINFTAPTVPGVYYLNLVASWWFSCNQFGEPLQSRYASNPLAILIVGCGQTECPADTTITTVPGNCNMIFSYKSLCVYDDKPGAGIIQTSGLASGVTYPLGNTTNTFVATDSDGKTTSCSYTVTVKAGTCGQPIQVYHIDTTTSTAKVKWKAGTPCVTGYQLRIREEISPGVWGSWSGWANKSGPGNEHMFTGLDDASFHQYQIRSKCGSATNSTVVNGWFWTLGGGALRKMDDDIVHYYSKVEEFKPDQKSIGDLSGSIDLQAIPNPARDFVSIYLDGFDSAPKELMMFDLMGKLIFRVKLDAAENNPEIDLKRLNVKPGLHMIRVSDGNNQKTIQLMIGS